MPVERKLDLRKMNDAYYRTEENHARSYSHSINKIYDLLVNNKFSELHEKLKRAIEVHSEGEPMFRLAFFEGLTNTNGKLLGNFLDYLEENDLPFFRRISQGFINLLSAIPTTYHHYNISEEFLREVYPRIYYGGIFAQVQKISSLHPRDKRLHFYQVFSSAITFGVPKDDVFRTIEIFSNKAVISKDDANYLLQYLSKNY